MGSKGVCCCTAAVTPLAACRPKAKERRSGFDYRIRKSEIGWIPLPDLLGCFTAACYIIQMSRQTLRHTLYMSTALLRVHHLVGEPIGADCSFSPSCSSSQSTPALLSDNPSELETYLYSSFFITCQRQNNIMSSNRRCHSSQQLISILICASYVRRVPHHKSTTYQRRESYMRVQASGIT